MGGMDAPTCSPEKVSPFGESAVKVERQPDVAVDDCWLDRQNRHRDLRLLRSRSEISLRRTSTVFPAFRQNDR